MRIKGQLLQICCACLCTNRALVSLALAGQQKLFSSLFDIEFNFSEDLVCWECLAMFKRIQEFQNKVIKAQNTVRLWDGTPLKCLSQLSAHSKKEYDFAYTEIVFEYEPPPPKPKKKRTRKKPTKKLNDTNTNVVPQSNLTPQLSDLTDINTDFDLDNTYLLQIENELQSSNIPQTSMIKLESDRNKSILLTDANAKIDYNDHLFTEDINVGQNIIINDTILQQGQNDSNLQQDGYMGQNDSSLQLDCGKLQNDSNVQPNGDKLQNDSNMQQDACKVESGSNMQQDACTVQDDSKMQQDDVKVPNDSTVESLYASKKEGEDGYRIEKMTEEEMRKMLEHDRNITKFKAYHYKCENCIMGFFDEASYSKHLTDRHSEEAGDRVCSICKQHFKRADTLAVHTAIHYRKYCCNFCEYSDTRLRRVTTHLYTHKPKPRCEKCNKDFQSPRSLKYHLNSAHHTERYQCDMCKKAYMVKSSLAKHITAVHCSEDVKMECKVCAKRVNKRIMHIHMQKHAPPEENAYCIECDRRFRNAICLRRHLKWSPKHRKKEDYQHTCNVCGMKFIARNKYLKHYSVTHLRQYPFQCDFCDKGYTSKKAMEQHVVVKHYGGTVAIKKDKLCDICGKGFLSRYVLRIHMRTHTGEKPETCKLCGASFAQTGSLTNHHKIVHLGIRPAVKNKRAYKKKKRSKKEKTHPLERDGGMFVNAH